MSSNSLSFRDLVLYVFLSIRETTQKQRAAGSFCTAGIQKQGEVIIICLSSPVLGELLFVFGVIATKSWLCEHKVGLVREQEHHLIGLQMAFVLRAVVNG